MANIFEKQITISENWKKKYTHKIRQKLVITNHGTKEIYDTKLGKI